MKKTLTILGMLLSLAVSYAQEGRVGINTETPQATLDIVASKTAATTSAQGVIFPRFATEERAKFINVAEGTMIYNITKKCLELFKGLDSGGDNGWHCTESSLANGLSVRFASFENKIPVYYSKANEKDIVAINPWKDEVYEYDKANGVIRFTITNNSGLDIINRDFTNAVRVVYPLQEGDRDGLTLFARGFDTQNVTILNGESKTLEYRLVGDRYNLKHYNLHAEEYDTWEGDTYSSNEDVRTFKTDLTEWGSEFLEFKVLPVDESRAEVAKTTMVPTHPIDFIFEDADLNLYIEKTILSEPTLYLN